MTTAVLVVTTAAICAAVVALVRDLAHDARAWTYDEGLSLAARLRAIGVGSRIAGARGSAQGTAKNRKPTPARCRAGWDG